MLNQGQVGTVPTSNNAAGSYPVTLAGPSGQAINSQLHGRHYFATRSGNIFFGSTLAAGVVIPFNAATLSAKFTLHNPANSGKNVELIDLNVLQVPGSALITGLGMGFQTNLTSGSGVPTSTTESAGLTMSGKVGTGTPSAKLYTAATLTNVAIANLAPILWLYNNVATTVITQGPTNYNFEGKIILPPDSLCTLVNSITGTQSAAAISISWGEYPV